MSHGFGYFPSTSAAFDLREPLGNVPSGYLAAVLKRGTANATILRRVALELSKRTDLTEATKHRAMREGTGNCDWCERKASYIHGFKRACRHHKNRLTAVRARVMDPVNEALDEATRERIARKRVTDGNMQFRLASRRR